MNKALLTIILFLIAVIFISGCIGPAEPEGTITGGVVAEHVETDEPDDVVEEPEVTGEPEVIEEPETLETSLAPGDVALGSSDLGYEFEIIENREVTPSEEEREEGLEKFGVDLHSAYYSVRAHRDEPVMLMIVIYKVNDPTDTAMDKMVDTLVESMWGDERGDSIDNTVDRIGDGSVAVYSEMPQDKLESGIEGGNYKEEIWSSYSDATAQSIFFREKDFAVMVNAVYGGTVAFSDTNTEEFARIIERNIE